MPHSKETQVKHFSKENTHDRPFIMLHIQGYYRNKPPNNFALSLNFSPTKTGKAGKKFATNDVSAPLRVVAHQLVTSARDRILLLSTKMLRIIQFCKW